MNAASYLLVRQPDHARLAGQIARHFAIPGAPAMDDDIGQAISLHDEGWSDFDNGCERLYATTASYSKANVALNPEGKPLSFLDIKAGDFLRAWRGSIEAAEAVAPIAGLMVSGHFRRLGEFGVSQDLYSDRDMQQVRQFVVAEQDREHRLLTQQNRSEKEVEYWTDVLQFCDLLSLYLCGGSAASVEFPQRIIPTGETLRLRLQDGSYALSPSPFSTEIEFSLAALPFPAEAGSLPTTLRWRLR